ncbi:MAG: leucyl/phenylalanyl-tRNA--protein transferase [Candidatus Muproteobacteria bacterium RBG_19FT_COMBO_61_10]|uniref:Leucyl/phenylalanyl-tRNA--protein transferase n=1 Tax=Candidatus Muproteobacteria bacterium RBG_19FT_COMBO_61_10 TaxID=1817761 RepID=A0A1F6UKI3_9PROT|nr:MAG: leucyl/phenylalanyl-tRNA--protein transferase [Candidatus Muproteobacteria bacterium RBG_19FT_COMBO_61_10]
MIILRPGTRAPSFPPVESATPDGLLAVGGDLSSERLLAAYRHGIFPWYNPGQPILWWSPDPRAVLYPDKLKISRSLRQTLKGGQLRVTFDTCFREVMLACAAPREQYPGGGTWISDDMIEAYTRLHAMGYAHSIETWHENRLVGGLYGVALGGVFFGESMFARATDASKVALVALVSKLREWGFVLIDCQIPSAHLTSLGAEEIARCVFLTELERALKLSGQAGLWQVAIATQNLTDTGGQP